MERSELQIFNKKRGALKKALAFYLFIPQKGLFVFLPGIRVMNAMRLFVQEELSARLPWPVHSQGPRGHGSLSAQGNKEKRTSHGFVRVSCPALERAVCGILNGDTETKIRSKKRSGRKVFFIFVANGRAEKIRREEKRRRRTAPPSPLSIFFMMEFESFRKYIWPPCGTGAWSGRQFLQLHRFQTVDLLRYYKLFWFWRTRDPHSGIRYPWRSSG